MQYIRNATLSLFLLASCQLLHASAVIDFESPAGGELFVVGQTQFIRLDSRTRKKIITIELTRDGGASFVKLGEIDNRTRRDGRNFLEVSITGPASSQCRIRAKSGSDSGLSGTFAIVTQATVLALPTGPAGGVLTGEYPNPQINSGAASTGAVLTANGSGGADWQSIPGSVLAGDATGPAGANTVQRLQGVPISQSAPADKNLLRYDAAAGKWAPSALNDPAGGDLAGSFPNPAVNTVGGQTASNIASGASAANAATNANTPSTIVKRNGSGAISAGQIESASGYVAGGNSNSNSNKNTLEVYDPSTNIWSTLAPMPTGRSEFALVACAGRLYAIGGAAGAGPLTVVEEYDPASNAWATKAPMITSRNGFGAAALGSSIHVFGGSNGGPTIALHERYDTSNDTWTARAPLPSAREDNLGAALNGKIYSIGGGASAAQGGEVFEYDPSSNRWRAKMQLQFPRRGTGIAIANDHAYVLGGEFMSTLVEFFSGQTYYLHAKN